MLEKQCTPKTLVTNLENMLEICDDGDILFFYIGRHRVNSKGIMNFVHTENTQVVK